MGRIETLTRGYRLSGLPKSSVILLGGQSEKMSARVTVPQDRWGAVCVPIVLEKRIGSEKAEYSQVIPFKFGDSFVRTWSVIGPFPNQAGRGFDAAYPPEKEIDLGASYQGAKGRVGWREMESDEDIIDLTSLFKPDQSVVAYALAYIHAPEAQSIRLLMGSDDGVKVWFNRREIWANNAARGVHPGDDRIKVRLRAGWNTLLLKIIQGSGGWAFCLELEDMLGGAPGGLRLSTKPPEG